MAYIVWQCREECCFPKMWKAVLLRSFRMNKYRNPLR